MLAASRPLVATASLPPYATAASARLAPQGQTAVSPLASMIVRRMARALMAVVCVSRVSRGRIVPSQLGTEMNDARRGAVESASRSAVISSNASAGKWYSKRYTKWYSKRYTSQKTSEKNRERRSTFSFCSLLLASVMQCRRILVVIIDDSVVQVTGMGCDTPGGRG